MDAKIIERVVKFDRSAVLAKGVTVTARRAGADAVTIRLEFDADAEIHLEQRRRSRRKWGTDEGFPWMGDDVDGA